MTDPKTTSQLDDSELEQIVGGEDQFSETEPPLIGPTGPVGPNSTDDGTGPSSEMPLPT